MKTSNSNQKRKAEFRYFPFEELPPVTTQVYTDIHLPLKDDKLVKLQESDPQTKQLRKQLTNKKFRPKHEHNGKQHPKMKTCQQQIFVHTHSNPRRLKRLSPHLSTRQARLQWIQKNICIFEKQIPLEGHEEIGVSALHKLPSLHKTQHQNSAAEKRPLLITTPTNGIHSN